MTVPPPEQDSTAEDPVMAALALLDPDVWSISSAVGVITVVRRWSDGSTDTVIIFSPESSYARRDSSRERLVWATQGPVGEVVRAARDLRAPGQPGAPSELVAERPELDP